MIAFVSGILRELDINSAVVEAGGIGYDIQISGSTFGALQREGLGKNVKLYTYFYMREDAVALFGFMEKGELALFRKVITVSGIGPKGGLALLSAMTADELTFAIVTGDVKKITQAQGIGKRTAERLVIDLKDELEIGAGFDPTGIDVDPQIAGLSEDSEENDAIEALTALGYGRPEAQKAVASAKKDGAEDTESLLKGALRYL